MEQELFEYTGTTGDKYKVRKLRFLERNDMFRSANKVTTLIDSETKKTKTEAFSDSQTLHEVMLQYAIVEAPWLDKPIQGKISLNELNGIKIEDVQDLIEFIDGMNFPKKEVEEK